MPVLRQLRRVEPQLPVDVLATVGGAPSACPLGHSPAAWRTRGQLPPGGELPVPAIEVYARTVTGRLLVDLLDNAHL